MKRYVKSAATVVYIASAVALVSGLGMIWLPAGYSRDSLEVIETTVRILDRVFRTSILLVVIAGLYISVQDAIARIERNTSGKPSPPTDKLPPGDSSSKGT